MQRSQPGDGAGSAFRAVQESTCLDLKVPRGPGLGEGRVVRLRLGRRLQAFVCFLKHREDMEVFQNAVPCPYGSREDLPLYSSACSFSFKQAEDGPAVLSARGKALRRDRQSVDDPSWASLLWTGPWLMAILGLCGFCV